MKNEIIVYKSDTISINTGSGLLITVHDGHNSIVLDVHNVNVIMVNGEKINISRLTYDYMKNELSAEKE